MPVIHGYVRVSTDAQVEGSSPAEQERRIEAVSTLRESPETLTMWRDLGISGSVPLGLRPAGAQMLAALQPGDAVVAAKLDRLFRNVEDALTQSRSWSEQNISLILIDMGTEPVTSSLTGRLYFTMLAAFAEFERGRINERIASGKQAKRSNGGFSGGQAPTGYEIVGSGRTAELKPNPQEQNMIRYALQIADQFNSSPTRIARKLNALGYRTRKNTPISATHVWRWIKNQNSITDI